MRLRSDAPPNEDARHSGAGEWKVAPALHVVWADTLEEWFTLPVPTSQQFWSKERAPHRKGKPSDPSARPPPLPSAESLSDTDAMIACGRQAARELLRRVDSNPPEKVYLVVERASFSKNVTLRRWLSRIDGIESVADIGGPAARSQRLEIRTKLRAAELAEALANVCQADRDADFALDVQRVYARSVIAVAKAR